MSAGGRPPIQRAEVRAWLGEDKLYVAVATVERAGQFAPKYSKPRATVGEAVAEALELAGFVAGE